MKDLCLGNNVNLNWTKLIEKIDMWCRFFSDLQPTAAVLSIL